MRPTRTIQSISILCALVLCAACSFHKPAVTNNDSSRDLNIEITTHLGDVQEYVEGDEISFLVNINRDAYVLIVYQDARQRLWQILPNEFNRQSKFRAGMYIPIPDTQQNYRFRASAPFGKETLYAFASDQPLASMQSKLVQNGLALLDIDIATLEQDIRAHSTRNGALISKASLTVTTRKKH